MRLPASEREVAATSSSRGWSQTIFAASAPVNPFAPATRTRAAGVPSSGCAASLFTEGPPRPSQARPYRPPPQLRNPHGGGGGRGTEFQPPRQGLPAPARALAPVEVEDIGL